MGLVTEPRPAGGEMRLLRSLTSENLKQRNLNCYMEFQKFERNRKTADAMRRNGPSQHRRDGIS